MKPRFLVAIIVLTVLVSGTSNAWIKVNHPPEAIISPESDQVVTVGTAVQICSISVDSEVDTHHDLGCIVKEEWDFDEGTGYVEYPVGTLTSHTFSQPGVYHVQLKVTDNGDYWGQNVLSDVDTVTITVRPSSGYTLIVPTRNIRTIQEAIDVAVNDSTIIVLKGTYAGDSNRDIDFKGKAITIRSTNPLDAAVVASTVIDCQASSSSKHRGFYFHTGEGNSSVLSGLTIKNGYQDNGGGIYCDHASPTINNCVITSNTSNGTGAGHGGGLYNFDSAPVLTNCSFISNTAGGKGSGMWCLGESGSQSSPVIKNSVFISNSANGEGGGIYSEGNSSLTLTNCTFTANSANSGGGIRIYSGCSVTLKNCILWGNNANSAGYEEISIASGSAAFSYCYVKNGLAGNGCGGNCTDDGHNSTDDPNLVVGDYHLQDSSPCINTGDPTTANYVDQTDIDGQRRVVGGRVDIGADEYKTSQPIYVDTDVTTSGDGSSWTNAIKELRDALSIATAGDEIWVAAGTYKPTGDTDQTKSFNLKYGVSVYGGFNGDEIYRDERDWVNNQTILSGDIDSDGVLNSGNSYHVVTGADGAVIDGFVITAGFGSAGGGMYNNNASPVVQNCSFTGNKATGNGGGIYNYDIIADGNSFPEITNCIFNGNIANGDGAGISNYGAFLHPSIMNCTFSGNNGITNAGGISNRYNRATVTNCILWDTSSGGCAEIYNSSATNVIFSYCDVQNGLGSCGGGNASVDGGNNITDNPSFAGNGIHLQSGSPCKGTGVGGTDRGVNWPVDSTLIGQDSPANFDPVDIAIDSFGDVCVLSSSDSQLYIYDLDLNLQGGPYSLPFLSNPEGIAVDNLGRICIADTGNNSVVVYFSGIGWFSVGDYGSGPGYFDHPSAVMVDYNGYIHVSDSGNNRVQVLWMPNSSTCNLAGIWGSYGTGDGQLNDQAGLCMAGPSQIYVADTGNSRVQGIYAQSSNFLNKVGSQGTQAGQFDSPKGVCYDIKRDQIIVADTGNDRVQIFQLHNYGGVGGDPTFVKTISDQGFSSPSAVACASTETEQIIFVADRGNSRIVKLTIPQDKPENTPLGVFEAFKAALQIYDTGKAASYVADTARDDYAQIFQTISSHLPDYVAGMGQMTLSSQTSGTAKYEMSYEYGGQSYSFPVTFIKDDNGNWKISTF